VRIDPLGLLTRAALIFAIVIGSLTIVSAAAHSPGDGRPIAARPLSHVAVSGAAMRQLLRIRPPQSREVSAAPSTTVPCPSKVIDVNLTTQKLVASACGQQFASTPITSGRPGLRTPTGTFAIFLKQQSVTFNSPWPQGDPNYYPPMFVAYAMEFLDGGYFLHTDPDEPVGGFGPGSQNGPYASHGCVHVPVPVMASLYEWADEGTTVSIHY
jgi:hypothetical protein